MRRFAKGLESGMTPSWSRDRAFWKATVRPAKFNFIVKPASTKALSLEFRRSSPEGPNVPKLRDVHCSVRARASDHFLGLVVGLAVTAQRGGFGAGVQFRQAWRDFRVLLLEEAVAGKIAFHQEGPELLHVEYPDRLREPQFLKPIDARDTLDPAPKQRAGAVTHGGEIDCAVGHEELAIDLRCHSALADDHVAARELEPAVEPLREPKRRGRGHGADGIAAVGVDTRRRRAVEVGKPQRLAGSRHAGPLFYCVLIRALARREDPAAQIGHRADLELAQFLGAGGKRKINGLEHYDYSAASAVRRSHSTVSRRM